MVYPQLMQVVIELMPAFHSIKLIYSRIYWLSCLHNRQFIDLHHKIMHQRGFPFSVLSFVLFGFNLHNSFKFTNNLFCRHFPTTIFFVCLKRPPSLTGSSALALLDFISIKRTWLRHNLFNVLQFIRIVSSVMLSLVIRSLIPA